MKKFSFTLILSLITISFFAQNFVLENKQWNTMLVALGMNGVQSTTEIHFIEGDSIYNATSYKKLWVSNDSLETSSLQGLLREHDNIVYFKQNNQDEGILYNFNLNIGDTAEVINLFSDITYPVPIEVINKELINVNGIDRMRWELEFDGYPDRHEFWLEGIGSLNGPIHTAYWYYMTCPSWTLLCYYNNEVIEYYNVIENTCYINTLYNNENAIDISITISPNPIQAGKNLHIESIEHITDIQLFNSQGKLLKIYQNPANFIDISHLKSGLYFLKIKSESKKSETHKLIVH
jgi:hypothetical protein